MADLKHLGEIKAAALEQQERLEANLQILEEEQLRIGTLIAARKQNEDRATSDLAAEEAEAEALAAKATSLKQLIDELTKRAQAVATAAKANRDGQQRRRGTGARSGHHQARACQPRP